MGEIHFLFVYLVIRGWVSKYVIFGENVNFVMVVQPQVTLNVFDSQLGLLHQKQSKKCTTYGVGRPKVESD